MKDFLELVERVSTERYTAMINKLIAEKLPVALLSFTPPENLKSLVNKLTQNNMYVACVATDVPPPWTILSAYR